MNKTIGTATIMLGLLAPFAAQAQTEISANVGYVSEYYYRGIAQKTSSASAGLDMAIGGLSVGTWGADVGDGAEIDLYGGFGLDLNDQISFSVGGTGYFYTGQFDDTYVEANLGLGLGPLALEYSFGEYHQTPRWTWDGDGDGTPDPVDYSFLGVSLEGEALYATLGIFGTDKMPEAMFDSGKYVEAGYGFSAADLDFTVSAILNDSELSGTFNDVGEPDGNLTFVLGVSKTFGLN